MSTGAVDCSLIGFYVHNHVFFGVCFSEVLGMFTTFSPFACGFLNPFLLPPERGEMVLRVGCEFGSSPIFVHFGGERKFDLSCSIGEQRLKNEVSCCGAREGFKTLLAWLWMQLLN